MVQKGGGGGAAIGPSANAPRTFTGMMDADGVAICEGDMVEGFGRRFVVRFHVERMTRVSPMNDEPVVVDVACYGFEWETPDGATLKLFPIFHPVTGESDLDTLLVVGSVYDEPEEE